MCTARAVGTQSPWSGALEKGFSFSSEPSRKDWRSGITTGTISAVCVQAGSSKFAGNDATKEPGIVLRKARLPYTPIRLDWVATGHNVGRGAEPFKGMVCQPREMAGMGCYRLKEDV